MNWQLVVLVPTHPPAQRRWIGGDDSTDFVAQVHRDGREDVVMGAATDEEIGNGPMGFVVGAVVAPPDAPPPTPFGSMMNFVLSRLWKCPDCHW
jgi:hypothetical protein